MAAMQISSTTFATLGAGRGPAVSALRGAAVSKLPELDGATDAGWASLALPAVGLALAGAALGAKRRANRVSMKARGRFVWKYGGEGTPKAPSWLTTPPTDGKGSPGGLRIPAWLTLQKWESFKAADRARSIRWYIQTHDDNGNKVMEKGKDYTIQEAVQLLIGMNSRAPLKFDATVEIAMQMNLDAKFPDQQVRTSISLPHGTGKSVRVAVFCGENEEDEVMAMGAYKAGKTLSDELQQEKIDFDILIAKPNMMPQLAKLGKVLGPKRLMPSPKSGTVVTDYKQAISDFSGKQIEVRGDKWSTVHCVAGKVSFGADKIVENIRGVLQGMADNKPAGAKKVFWNKIYIGTTMSPSIKISASQFPALQLEDED